MSGSRDGDAKRTKEHTNDPKPVNSNSVLDAVNTTSKLMPGIAERLTGLTKALGELLAGGKKVMAAEGGRPPTLRIDLKEESERDKQPLGEERLAREVAAHKSESDYTPKEGKVPIEEREFDFKRNLISDEGTTADVHSVDLENEQERFHAAVKVVNKIHRKPCYVKGEADILKEASALGIAPKFMACDPENKKIVMGELDTSAYTPIKEASIPVLGDEKFLAKLATALNMMHDAGIAHNDLPYNVMIEFLDGQIGDIKILDYGSAVMKTEDGFVYANYLHKNDFEINYKDRKDLRFLQKQLSDVEDLFQHIFKDLNNPERAGEYNKIRTFLWEAYMHGGGFGRIKGFMEINPENLGDLRIYLPAEWFAKTKEYVRERDSDPVLDTSRGAGASYDIRESNKEAVLDLLASLGLEATKTNVTNAVVLIDRDLIPRGGFEDEETTRKFIENAPLVVKNYGLITANLEDVDIERYKDILLAPYDVNVWILKNFGAENIISIIGEFNAKKTENKELDDLGIYLRVLKDHSQAEKTILNVLAKEFSPNAAKVFLRFGAGISSAEIVEEISFRKTVTNARKDLVYKGHTLCWGRAIGLKKEGKRLLIHVLINHSLEGFETEKQMNAPVAEVKKERPPRKLPKTEFKITTEKETEPKSLREKHPVNGSVAVKAIPDMPLQHLTETQKEILGLLVGNKEMKEKCRKTLTEKAENSGRELDSEFHGLYTHLNPEVSSCVNTLREEYMKLWSYVAEKAGYIMLQSIKELQNEIFEDSGVRVDEKTIIKGATKSALVDGGIRRLKSGVLLAHYRIWISNSTLAVHASGIPSMVKGLREYGIKPTSANLVTNPKKVFNKTPPTKRRIENIMLLVIKGTSEQGNKYALPELEANRLRKWSELNKEKLGETLDEWEKKIESAIIASKEAKGAGLDSDYLLKYVKPLEYVKWQMGLAEKNPYKIMPEQKKTPHEITKKRKKGEAGSEPVDYEKFWTQYSGNGRREYSIPFGSPLPPGYHDGFGRNPFRTEPHRSDHTYYMTREPQAGPPILKPDRISYKKQVDAILNEVGYAIPLNARGYLDDAHAIGIIPKNFKVALNKLKAPELNLSNPTFRELVIAALCVQEKIKLTVKVIKNKNRPITIKNHIDLIRSKGADKLLKWPSILIRSEDYINFRIEKLTSKAVPVQKAPEREKDFYKPEQDETKKLDAILNDSGLKTTKENIKKAGELFERQLLPKEVTDDKDALKSFIINAGLVCRNQEFLVDEIAVFDVFEYRNVLLAPYDVNVWILKNFGADRIISIVNEFNAKKRKNSELTDLALFLRVARYHPEVWNTIMRKLTDAYGISGRTLLFLGTEHTLKELKDEDINAGLRGLRGRKAPLAYTRAARPNFRGRIILTNLLETGPAKIAADEIEIPEGLTRLAKATIKALPGVSENASGEVLWAVFRLAVKGPFTKKDISSLAKISKDRLSRIMRLIEDAGMITLSYVDGSYTLSEKPIDEVIDAVGKSAPAKENGNLGRPAPTANWAASASIALQKSGGAEKTNEALENRRKMLKSLPDKMEGLQKDIYNAIISMDETNEARILELAATEKGELEKAFLDLWKSNDPAVNILLKQKEEDFIDLWMLAATETGFFMGCNIKDVIGILKRDTGLETDFFETCKGLIWLSVRHGLIDPVESVVCGGEIVTKPAESIVLNAVIAAHYEHYGLLEDHDKHRSIIHAKPSSLVARIKELEEWGVTPTILTVVSDKVSPRELLEKQFTESRIRQTLKEIDMEDGKILSIPRFALNRLRKLNELHPTELSVILAELEKKPAYSRRVKFVREVLEGKKSLKEETDDEKGPMMIVVQPSAQTAAVHLDLGKKRPGPDRRNLMVRNGRIVGETDMGSGESREIMKGDLAAKLHAKNPEKAADWIVENLPHDKAYEAAELFNELKKGTEFTDETVLAGLVIGYLSDELDHNLERILGVETDQNYINNLKALLAIYEMVREQTAFNVMDISFASGLTKDAVRHKLRWHYGEIELTAPVGGKRGTRIPKKRLFSGLCDLMRIIEPAKASKIVENYNEDKSEQVQLDAKVSDWILENIPQGKVYAAKERFNDLKEGTKFTDETVLAGLLLEYAPDKASPDLGRLFKNKIKDRDRINARKLLLAIYQTMGGQMYITTEALMDASGLTRAIIDKNLKRGYKDARLLKGFTLRQVYRPSDFLTEKDNWKRKGRLEIIVPTEDFFNEICGLMDQTEPENTRLMRKNYENIKGRFKKKPQEVREEEKTKKVVVEEPVKDRIPGISEEFIKAVEKEFKKDLWVPGDRRAQQILAAALWIISKKGYCTRSMVAARLTGLVNKSTVDNRLDILLGKSVYRKELKLKRTNVYYPKIELEERIIKIVDPAKREEAKQKIEDYRKSVEGKRPEKPEKTLEKPAKEPGKKPRDLGFIPTAQERGIRKRREEPPETKKKKKKAHLYDLGGNETGSVEYVSGPVHKTGLGSVAPASAEQIKQLTDRFYGGIRKDKGIDDIYGDEELYMIILASQGGTDAKKAARELLLDIYLKDRFLLGERIEVLGSRIEPSRKDALKNALDYVNKEDPGVLTIKRLLLDLGFRDVKKLTPGEFRMLREHAAGCKKKDLEEIIGFKINNSSNSLLLLSGRSDYGIWYLKKLCGYPAEGSGEKSGSKRSMEAHVTLKILEYLGFVETKNGRLTKHPRLIKSRILDFDLRLQDIKKKHALINTEKLSKNIGQFGKNGAAVVIEVLKGSKQGEAMKNAGFNKLAGYNRMLRDLKNDGWLAGSTNTGFVPTPKLLDLLEECMNKPFTPDVRGGPAPQSIIPYLTGKVPNPEEVHSLISAELLKEGNTVIPNNYFIEIAEKTLQHIKKGDPDAVAVEKAVSEVREKIRADASTAGRAWDALYRDLGPESFFPYGRLDEEAKYFGADILKTVPTDGTLLILGGGPCKPLFPFLERVGWGGEKLNVDISPFAVKKANAAGIPSVTGNVQKLRKSLPKQIKPGKVKAVIANFVFEYLKKPEDGIKEVFETLGEGGIAVIRFHHPESKIIHNMRKKNAFMKFEPQQTFPEDEDMENLKDEIEVWETCLENTKTPDEWAELLKNAGFEIVEQKVFGSPERGPDFTGIAVKKPKSCENLKAGDVASLFSAAARDRFDPEKAFEMLAGWHRTLDNPDETVWTNKDDNGIVDLLEDLEQEIPEEKRRLLSEQLLAGPVDASSEKERAAVFFLRGMILWTLGFPRRTESNFTACLAINHQTRKNAKEDERTAAYRNLAVISEALSCARKDLSMNPAGPAEIRMYEELVENAPEGCKKEAEVFVKRIADAAKKTAGKIFNKLKGTFDPLIDRWEDIVKEFQKNIEGFNRGFRWEMENTLEGYPYQRLLCDLAIEVDSVNPYAWLKRAETYSCIIEGFDRDPQANLDTALFSIEQAIRLYEKTNQDSELIKAREIKEEIILINSEELYTGIIKTSSLEEARVKAARGDDLEKKDLLALLWSDSPGDHFLLCRAYRPYNGIGLMFSEIESEVEGTSYEVLRQRMTMVGQGYLWRSHLTDFSRRTLFEIVKNEGDVTGWSYHENYPLMHEYVKYVVSKYGEEWLYHDIRYAEPIKTIEHSLRAGETLGEFIKSRDGLRPAGMSTVNVSYVQRDGKAVEEIYPINARLRDWLQKNGITPNYVGDMCYVADVHLDRFVAETGEPIKLNDRESPENGREDQRTKGTGLFTADKVPKEFVSALNEEFGLIWRSRTYPTLELLSAAFWRIARDGYAINKGIAELIGRGIDNGHLNKSKDLKGILYSKQYHAINPELKTKLTGNYNPIETLFYATPEGQERIAKAVRKSLGEDAAKKAEKSMRDFRRSIENREVDGTYEETLESEVLTIDEIEALIKEKKKLVQDKWSYVMAKKKAGTRGRFSNRFFDDPVNVICSIRLAVEAYRSEGKEGYPSVKDLKRLGFASLLLKFRGNLQKLFKAGGYMTEGSSVYDPALPAYKEGGRWMPGQRRTRKTSDDKRGQVAESGADDTKISMEEFGRALSAAGCTEKEKKTVLDLFAGKSSISDTKIGLTQQTRIILRRMQDKKLLKVYLDKQKTEKGWRKYVWTIDPDGLKSILDKEEHDEEKDVPGTEEITALIIDALYPETRENAEEQLRKIAGTVKAEDLDMGDVFNRMFASDDSDIQGVVEEHQDAFMGLWDEIVQVQTKARREKSDKSGDPTGATYHYVNETDDGDFALNFDLLNRVENATNSLIDGTANLRNRMHRFLDPKDIDGYLKVSEDVKVQVERFGEYVKEETEIDVSSFRENCRKAGINLEGISPENEIMMLNLGLLLSWLDPHSGTKGGAGFGFNEEQFCVREMIRPENTVKEGNRMAFMVLAQRIGNATGIPLKYVASTNPISFALQLTGEVCGNSTILIDPAAEGAKIKAADESDLIGVDTTFIGVYNRLCYLQGKGRFEEAVKDADELIRRYGRTDSGDLAHYFVGEFYHAWGMQLDEKGITAVDFIMAHKQYIEACRHFEAVKGAGMKKASAEKAKRVEAAMKTHYPAFAGSQDTRERYKNTLELYNDGFYDMALEIFEGIVFNESNKEHALQALHMCCLCNMKLGRKEEAARRLLELEGCAPGILENMEIDAGTQEHLDRMRRGKNTAKGALNHAKIVFIDIDDTVINTSQATISGLQAMMDYINENTILGPELEFDEFYKMGCEVRSELGTSRMDESFARQLLRKTGIQQDRINEIMDAAIAAYDTKFNETLELYPDVLPLMEGLRDSGKKVVLITNGMENWPKEKLEKAFGKEGRSDLLEDIDVLTPETEKVKKPNPALIEGKLSKEGYAKKDAIIIGDRLRTDVCAAKAAGIPVIRVLNDDSVFRESVEGDEYIKPDYEVKGLRELVMGKSATDGRISHMSRDAAPPGYSNGWKPPSPWEKRKMRPGLLNDIRHSGYGMMVEEPRDPSRHLGRGDKHLYAVTCELMHERIQEHQKWVLGDRYPSVDSKMLEAETVALDTMVALPMLKKCRNIEARDERLAKEIRTYVHDQIVEFNETFGTTHDPDRELSNLYFEIVDSISEDSLPTLSKSDLTNISMTFIESRAFEEGLEKNMEYMDRYEKIDPGLVRGGARQVLLSEIVREIDSKSNGVHDENIFKLEDVSGFPNTFLMGGHGEALSRWLIAGIKGATLLHFDTHNDLRDGLGEVELQPLPITPGEAANVKHGIDDYIAAAVSHGLIDEIYWVIPQYMDEGILKSKYFGMPKDIKGSTTIYKKDIVLHSATIIVVAYGEERQYAYLRTYPPKEADGIKELGEKGIEVRIEGLREIKLHKIRVNELYTLDKSMEIVLNIAEDYFGSNDIIHEEYPLGHWDSDRTVFREDMTSEEEEDILKKGISHVFNEIKKNGIKPATTILSLSFDADESYTPRKWMGTITKEIVEAISSPEISGREPVIYSIPKSAYWNLNGKMEMIPLPGRHQGMIAVTPHLRDNALSPVLTAEDIISDPPGTHIEVLLNLAVTPGTRQSEARKKLAEVKEAGGIERILEVFTEYAGENNVFFRPKAELLCELAGPKEVRRVLERKLAETGRMRYAADDRHREPLEMKCEAIRECLAMLKEPTAEKDFKKEMANLRAEMGLSVKKDVSFDPTASIQKEVEAIPLEEAKNPLTNAFMDGKAPHGALTMAVYGRSGLKRPGSKPEPSLHEKIERGKTGDVKPPAAQETVAPQSFDTIISSMTHLDGPALTTGEASAARDIFDGMLKVLENVDESNAPPLFTLQPGAELSELLKSSFMKHAAGLLGLPAYEGSVETETDPGHAFHAREGNNVKGKINDLSSIDVRRNAIRNLKKAGSVNAGDIRGLNRFARDLEAYIKLHEVAFHGVVCSFSNSYVETLDRHTPLDEVFRNLHPVSRMDGVWELYDGSTSKYLVFEGRDGFHVFSTQGPVKDSRQVITGADRGLENGEWIYYTEAIAHLMVADVIKKEMGECKPEHWEYYGKFLELIEDPKKMSAVARLYGIDFDMNWGRVKELKDAGRRWDEILYTLVKENGIEVTEVRDENLEPPISEDHANEIAGKLKEESVSDGLIAETFVLILASGNEKIAGILMPDLQGRYQMDGCREQIIRVSGIIKAKMPG
ncbi:MAG: HAD hydrolase-like protein [Candidatus Altiarchaeota archaeon]|nr:HAD hydrolase-like protein [Candidatus Altiarchaeota archaeon]